MMHLVRTIIEHTAAVFACTPEELLGRSRKQSIVTARQAAMWAIRRRYPSLSLMQIGAATGGRHYTTVIHALMVVEQRAADDPAYRDRLHRVLARIGARGVLPDPSALDALACPAVRWHDHAIHDRRA